MGCQCLIVECRVKTGREWQIMPVQDSCDSNAAKIIKIFKLQQKLFLQDF